MEVERLAAPMGAIVSGVDVTTVDDAAWAEIDALFVTHHLLVFPGQKLTEEEHLGFAARWGSLRRHPYNSMAGHPELIELRNVGKRRDVNQHWHSDMTYEPEPPKLTMLYAREAPSIGGDTAFANQQLAYAELSDGLRVTVDELRAVHTAEGLASIYGADPAEAPRAVHPVVRTHDQSGARALYVCRAFTQRFDGWTRTESEGLLSYLFDHAVRPEFQARHRWRPGDLVMWDNRSVLHFAVHDHADDEPRTIHRCQVAGPRPE